MRLSERALLRGRFPAGSGWRSLVHVGAARRSTSWDELAPDGRTSRRSPLSLSHPVADVRALAGGDPSAVSRLQRSIGNARLGSVLRLARCRDGSDSTCSCFEHREPDRRLLARQPLPSPAEDVRPPQTGPQPGKKPPLTGCSFVFKADGVYVTCEGVPGIGSTPDIPVDLRKIPREIRKMIPKGDKKEPLGPLPGWPGFPGLSRPGSGLPPRWFEDLCLRDPTSLLCQLTPPPSVPGHEPAAGPAPVGRFWSYDVTFEFDLPGAGAARSGMTPEGVATLATAVSWLQLDPTLQVRLAGHTSSEGGDADNLALSQRRAKAVYAELAAKGLGARVMDLVGGDGPPGCTRVEFGMWACGETQAAQDASRPEDRKVVMTLLRNAPVRWP